VGSEDVRVEHEPEGLGSRQCGRCRKWFEGDPTLHPTALPEWWACPACHAALLGNRRAVSAVGGAGRP